jgi:hypothetical protein
VSTTTLAGVTGTCFKGDHGLGGQGGHDGRASTFAAGGADGSDGSQCAAGGEIAHSGSFMTLAPGEGEPAIPPFPSGGGGSGAGGGGAGSGGGGPATPIPALPIPAPFPTPKIVPFIALHAKKLVATGGGAVTLTVACPAGGAACSETLSLTTTVPVHGKATAVAKKKMRTIKLGSVRLSVAPGRTAKARLRLTKAARTLLKKAHRHRLKATITLTAGHRTHRMSVTLALGRAKT